MMAASSLYLRIRRFPELGAGIPAGLAVLAATSEEVAVQAATDARPHPLSEDVILESVAVMDTTPVDLVELAAAIFADLRSCSLPELGDSTPTARPRRLTEQLRPLGTCRRLPENIAMMAATSGEAAWQTIGDHPWPGNNVPESATTAAIAVDWPSLAAAPATTAVVAAAAPGAEVASVPTARGVLRRLTQPVASEVLSETTAEVART